MEGEDPNKKPRKVPSKRKLNKLKLQRISDNSFQNNQKIFERAQEFINEAPQIQPQQRSSSQKKLNKQDAETTFNQGPTQFVTDFNKQSLITPYEFLNKSSASFHTILFPHFTCKSINFWMSLLMIIAFAILLILNYSKPQKPVTWSCTLFQLQNKFFPRIRYNYEFWRIPVSSIFHSNISHIILNIIGIQIYGYFIQWYYGRLRYAITLVISIICAHLLSCVTQVQTVSTTPSSILYAFIALKAFFFLRYRDYQSLENRRGALYGLLALIFAMNLIVLFIGSNVDYGAHIAGFIVGALCGAAFYPFTKESKSTKAVKYLAFIALFMFFVALCVVCFTMNQSLYTQLNSEIDSLC